MIGPALLTVLTFAAALLTFLGLYSILADLYLKDRARVSERLSEEARERRRSRIVRTMPARPAEGATPESGPPPAPAPGAWLEHLIERSGLSLTVGQLFLIAGSAAAVLGVAAFFITGTLLAAVLTAALGFAAPFAFVRIMQKRRMAAMLAQIPDAFELVARVIRAGKTVPQAMRAVSEEIGPPLASEFAYCTEQQDLGLPPELALRDLSDRTGLLEIQIFVVALLVQRQAGGNLSEILENLATIVRDRFRVREKIRVLTSQGRLEAMVLVALPPFMFLAMLYLNPAYALLLLDHPYPLLAVIGGMALGVLWIRRIVRFEF